MKAFIRSFLILVSLSASVLHAQEKSLIVVSLPDNQPLSGVTFYDSDSVLIAISDPWGYVHLNLSAYSEDDSLLIGKHGYAPWTLKKSALLGMDSIRFFRPGTTLSEVIVQAPTLCEELERLFSKIDFFKEDQEYHLNYRKYTSYMDKRFVGDYEINIIFGENITKTKSSILLKNRISNYVLPTPLLEDQFGYIIFSELKANWDFLSKKLCQLELLSLSEDESLSTISYRGEGLSGKISYSENSISFLSLNTQNTSTEYVINNNIPNIILKNSYYKLEKDTFLLQYFILPQNNNTNILPDIQNKFYNDYINKIDDINIDFIIKNLIEKSNTIKNGAFDLKIKEYNNEKLDKIINKLYKFSKNDYIDFNSYFIIDGELKKYQVIYNGNQTILKNNKKSKIYDYNEYGIPINKKHIFEPLIRTSHFFSSFTQNGDFYLRDTVIENIDYKYLLKISNDPYLNLKNLRYLFFDSSFIVKKIVERQYTSNIDYWEIDLSIDNLIYNSSKVSKEFISHNLVRNTKTLYKKTPRRRTRLYRKYEKIIDKKILNSENSINDISNNQHLDSLLSSTPILEKQGHETENSNYTLFYFWYNACLYCKQLYPDIASLHTSFQNKVRFYGVNPIDKIPEFVEEGWSVKGMNFPTYFAARALTNHFDVVAYPQVVLINANGEVIYMANGYDQLKNELPNILSNLK